ncbi:MAG: porin [Cyclobacteriaceae bacterium]|nr:porin [Cyclobacteriaceae bacterium]
MKKIILVALLISVAFGAQSQDSTVVHAPFEGMDFTWLNGNNRQSVNLLTYKYFTGTMIMDTYWNYSFNNPMDNTINSSSIIGRHNEVTLNMASIGGEVMYNNVIARIHLQAGSMLSVIQETDPTVTHGRNLRTTDLKFIREAVVGYQWNKWNTIRFETGIFMSFIGLESYIAQENWSYQRSMVCDFTPFYFTGARFQIHPDKRWKIEPWIMNGWYSYGKFNKAASVGLATYFRPNENTAFVANFYYGTDTKNIDGRVRFHHDNSVMIRYKNRPASHGISRMAFSLNSHYGFENGGSLNGIVYPSLNETYFVGTSLANRIWFKENKFAITIRGGYLTNPGRYLPVNPAPLYNDPVSGAAGYTDIKPGDLAPKFEAWELTGTFDYMPNEFITLRMEMLNRHSSVPYFAGPGGTTSVDGWQGTTDPNLGTPQAWKPDLRTLENRMIIAIVARF